jgi:hypothetical protein
LSIAASDATREAGGLYFTGRSFICDTTLPERLIRERFGRGNHELRGPAKPAYHTKSAAVAGD